MSQVKVQSSAGASFQDETTGRIVIAGPSSALTIPGIVVSQIVGAFAQNHEVVRINVDSRADFDAGLFRAPSLAAALRKVDDFNVEIHDAPTSQWLRGESFDTWMSPEVRVAVAFVWPGIDSHWVHQFIAAAKEVGVWTTVVCASVPKSASHGIGNLTDLIRDADLVLVGSETDAQVLGASFASLGPKVETHTALSLTKKVPRPPVKKIMAFLPQDDVQSLSTLLAAFDAIPEAWIENYRLAVVMRYGDSPVQNLIEDCYHSDFVSLTGDHIASDDLREMVASSSALIIADPVFDSRAFLMAVDSGLPIVVVVSAELPGVGRGYVGALLADLDRPVSVYVALAHALRLTDLQFPRPAEWDELEKRILGSSSHSALRPDAIESTTRSR